MGFSIKWFAMVELIDIKHISIIYNRFLGNRIVANVKNILFS